MLHGGPGAGKTERLLKVMEGALDRGVEPDRIAVVTFTRVGAEEAKSRACAMFGLTPDQLPYVRTIHSFAFRELGLRRGDVLDEPGLAEVAELTGELQLTGASDSDGPAARRSADALLTLDHYARTTMTSLRDAWSDHGGEVDWFRLLRFSEAYARYKRDRGVLDFTDMLERYVAERDGGAPVELAVVDEGQDLTRLQWAVVERAFSRADEMWVAGDDLQSIHRWAGAAEDYFLGLPFEHEVLPVSHRLPRAIFALSEEVAARVERRYRKEWSPSPRDGKVTWVASPTEVDLSVGSRAPGKLDWLLLARTHHQLAPLIELARRQGVVYSTRGKSSVKPEHLAAIRAYEALRAGKRVEGSEAAAALEAMGVKREAPDGTTTAAELGVDVAPIWHDALVRISLQDREYYLACLRRGERLDRPRVRIDTVHGVKGAQAERTLLVTDLTYRTRRGFELDPDSEHRVFYVGLTRASEELVISAPSGAYGYRL